MRTIGTPHSEITPLAATVLAPPHPVLGADDREHLVYELFVTNPTSSVMKLQKIDALGPNGIVGTLSGADLDGATRPLVPSATTEIQPAQVSRVFLDTTFAKKAPLPSSVSHEITFTLTRTGSTPTTATVVSGRTNVVLDEAIEISPPLEGKRWITAGGCCFPPSYHRTATLPVNGAFHGPERFAIDFVELNANNKLFNGPQGALSSYAYFGSKVFSVAGGKVVGRLDSIPESTPPDFPSGATAETAGGNYIMIDIGHGLFAYYAHLQPGSLRVHLGDRVRDGQVIGCSGTPATPMVRTCISRSPTARSHSGPKGCRSCSDRSRAGAPSRTHWTTSRMARPRSSVPRPPGSTATSYHSKTR